MKMKGLMKKILLLLAVVLSFGTVMAADWISFNLSTVDGDAGVTTPFNYVRIVSSTTGGTTYNTIVFGAGQTVATKVDVSDDFLGLRLSLSSDEVGAITKATSSNLYFYFEFYNNDTIMGYSDYVSAADLAASLSHFTVIPWEVVEGKTLPVTGYAAPEPTSGLLLLVGGALLGLRRKRRVA